MLDQRGNLFPFIAPMSLSIDLMNVKHPYSLVRSSNSLLSGLVLYIFFFVMPHVPMAKWFMKQNETYPKLDKSKIWTRPQTQ
jgi:hypothetical protein